MYSVVDLCIGRCAVPAATMFRSEKVNRGIAQLNKLRVHNRSNAVCLSVYVCTCGCVCLKNQGGANRKNKKVGHCDLVH